MQKIYYTSLFTAVLLAFITNNTFAQTTWTGASDTDWANTANWSAGVPDATDDVTIPGSVPNNPTIGAAGALANSVNVQTSATLTINATGSLTINGSRFFNTSSSASTAGFYNEGTVSNSGNLILGSSASVGSFGIQNFATFNNNSGGEISIDRSTLSGLENSTGIFTNAAKITIGAVASVGSYGIENFATFNNNSGGEICIDRSSGNGLYNRGDKFRVGTFTNAAKITIGAVASAGEYGIFNYATINNNSGGEISIDQSTITGLKNLSGTFTNAAKITIGAVASVGNEGIRNQGTFNNSTCIAIIRIASDAIVNNTGTFSNAGLIIENASGNSAISTNTGVVQNLNGGTFAVGSGNPPITSTTPLVNACCTPPNAAIAITENNVIFNPFTNNAYYNASYTDGILCTGPAVPNPSTSATLTASGGDTYLWSNNATTAAITVSTAGTYTVIVTTVPGCTSTATRTISVNSAPNPGTISATPQINSSGSYGVCWGSTIQLSSTVSGGVWSAQPHNPQIVSISSGGIVTPLFTSINVDTNSVYYTVTSLGCYNSSRPQVVVIDPRNPGTISGNTTLCPGNTSQLTTNGQSGGVWSSSNNAVATVSSTGLVSPLSNGTTTISYTLYGLSPTTCPYSATALVTVAPCCAGPAALCKPANAVLVGNSATILPASVDNGSTAACGLQSITVSPNTFNCSQVGTPQTVTLTVTDVNNASNACTATVTVIDNTAPSITCPPNATVNANASCQGTVGAYSAATLADNCNPLPTVTQSPASSTVMTGHNTDQTVTLTANDGNGNTATCSLTVTLKDVTPPNVICPGNQFANVGANCIAPMPNYAGSLSYLDNCSSTSNTQTPAAGTPLSLGTTTTLTLIVSDMAGNTASCVFNVTARDVIPPSITCPANTTVAANASCQNTIGAYSAATLSDNCNPSPAVTQSPASSTILTGHNTAQTVTLTANDGNGNTATCALVVTLKDITPPTITCPANAAVQASANCTATLASYTAAATANDNCTANPSKTQSPVSGTTITGSQVVTLTATDAASNSTACTFAVTVVDQTVPSITCPANATVPAGANCAAMLASYTAAATANDNCTANPSKTQSPVSGTTITGIQVVTLTATDAANNSATCTFTVTVVDQTVPSITCPANTTVPAGATCAATLASYTAAATANDNCTANPSKTQSPVSGTTITGSQVVTLTATDGASNSATCTFTVTVVDQTVPSITCPANATVPAGATCTASLPFYTAAATANDNCTANPSKTQSPLSGTIIAGSQIVTLTATDGANNSATCTFTVTVVDQTVPSITCPANATVPAGATCTASLPFYTAAATANDNCTANPSKAQSPVSGTTITGSQVVTLTATDGANNSAACTFTVTVVDATAPTVICKNFSTNLNAAGAASITTANVFQSGSDNCGTLNQVSVLPNAFTCANKGTNTVVLTVSDGASNTATCSVIVTVVDAIVPTIICPANIVRANDLNQCNALVVYPIPITSDNCAGAVASHFSGGVSGAVFQKGTTTVIWRATDGAGLTSSCSFSITINDTQKPNITCPVNQTRSTDLGQCSAVVTYPTPTGTDNCGLPTGQPVWISGGTNAAGSTATFQKGATNVIWQATDAAGNAQTCSFRVTVNDTQAPTMTCPAAISLSTATNTCSAVATYTNPSFTDNCAPTTGTAIRISGLVSGSAFSLGNSNVVFQATDAAGNTRRCTMVVLVTNNQPPVVTCPPSIVITGSGTPCTSTVFFANATASDNCAGTLTPFLFSGLASGSAFPAGVTTNTFRAVAPNGQSANCSFTVTVNCGSGMGNEGLEDRNKELEALQTMTHKTSLGLTIAPNPAIYSVTMSIEGVEANGGTLLVFDQIGRLVQQQVIASEQRTTTLQVAEFAPGLYRIMLKTGDGTVTKTLVVVKE